MCPPEDASAEPRDPLIDRVVAGNFQILDLIGSGAMGNVYRALQLSLNKNVAVKVLHPHLMDDEKLVGRFQREAKSASRLDHPNSIHIIDSGEDVDGTLYIAMEYLSGRDLAQVLRDDFPLALPRIVRIMSQVFAALDEAHAEGVIHRDLKPSNIMLIERRDESDFVKVCDYGIAKALPEDGKGESQMLTLQGLVCGTPEYMSPEQARGETLDGRADLYSAAVILYQMVTGDIPFRAPTPVGIVSRHLSEAPMPPSKRRPDLMIPPSLDDLILRGMAKSPELRPVSAAVFRDELEAILGRPVTGRKMTRASGGPLSAQTTVVQSNEPWTRETPKRSRGRLGLGILVAALVLGGGALGLRMFGDREDAGHPTVAAPAPASIPAPSSAVPAEVPAIAPSGTATEPGAAPAPAPPGGPQQLPATTPAAPSPVTAKTAAKATAKAPAKAVAMNSVAPRLQHHAARSSEGSATKAGASGDDSAGPSATAHAQAARVAGEPPEANANGPAAVPAPSTAAAPPAPKSALGEAERMLAQGDVAEACRRGEDVRKATPQRPEVFKFLGKCYMRAGKPDKAKENYRRYLELAPAASDRLFIESIVK